MDIYTCEQITLQTYAHLGTLIIFNSLYIYTYTRSISQVIRRLIFCLAAATERIFQFPFLVVCNQSIDYVDQCLTYVIK